MFYKLGSAGRALKKLGAIDFATTIAPGLRDVLLTGKACEAVRRKDKSGRFVYDYVVMDAPPTGRITRFLNVNDEVAGLAKIGPIHNQAQAVMRVLKSPETAVHLVTLLEEMPVQETADGIAELRAARPAGGADHREHGAARRAGRRPTWTLAARGAAHGASPRRSPQAGLGGARRGGLAERLVDPLLEQAREYAERVALERDAAGRAGRASGCPLHELPLLAEGMDLAGCTTSPGSCGNKGSHDAGTRTRTALARTSRRARARTSTRCSTTRRPASWSAAARAAWARPPPRRPSGVRAAERGRKVVVLTIDPARRLAQSMGIDALDNTPRRVKGVDGRGRRTARDDARHEAHLRRDRRGARGRRPGAARSWRTPSTSPCRPASRARRSTWRWRSWASCGRRDEWDLIVVDTPPSPLRAGLPGRARSGSARSWTASSSGC